jgi:hypothetical protein
MRMSTHWLTSDTVEFLFRRVWFSIRLVFFSLALSRVPRYYQSGYQQMGESKKVNSRKVRK